MSDIRQNWYEVNQQSLLAELSEVRRLLEKRAGHQSDEPTPPAAVELPDSALNVLCASLGLTPFERAVLLLCAGVELDGRFPALCAAAQGDPRRSYATFSLALTTLPEAHWSALTPAGALRHWRLVELTPGEGLTLAALRIDERILHFMAGVSYLDERVAALVEPLPELGGNLPASQAQLAERMLNLWSTPAENEYLTIQLCGDDPAAARMLVSAAAQRLNVSACVLRPTDLPANTFDRELFARLLERETLLTGMILMIEGGVQADDALRAALPFVDRLRGPLAVFSADPLNLRHPALRLDVTRPTSSEQRALWQQAVGALAQSFNGSLDQLVTQFNLSPAEIRTASISLRPENASSPGEAFRALWEACRSQARPRMERLAQRIDPVAGWDDLVLPEREKDTLREIAAHVRHRATVYDRWGFAARSLRGLGISALFTGTSGTGKTMAAEVLANELRLDLYRIDLSQVVSKYIGETEKNLRRVFDAAETGSAILLFDEADALFGRRSDVKDAHDRYANIEISYLLQRMESYRGLAILTTNMKSALDQAFMRRIRFVVPFHFPDEGERAEIWRRIFPAGVPTQGLDIQRLAQLNISGGNIRSIALNAAFLAADAGEPLGMTHVLQASRSEYVKLEKPLTQLELEGWP